MTFKRFIVLICLQVSTITLNVHAKELDNKCPLLNEDVLQHIKKTNTPQSGTDRDGGIGGTGISAEITSTSPLKLAGCQVELKPGIKIVDDLAEMEPGMLMTGHFANLSVSVRNNHLVATSVVLQHLLEGQVTKKMDATHLEVMGQRVVLMQGTMPEPAYSTKVSKGDYVKVSGLRQADGSVVASRIEVFGHVAVAGVTGKLEKNGTQYSVGGINVEGNPDNAWVGKKVLAVGKWTGNEISGTRFKPQFANAGQKSPSQVLIEGSFVGSDDKFIELSDEPKMTYSSVAKEKLKDLAQGRRITVIGKTLKNGTVEVQQILEP